MIKPGTVFDGIFALYDWLPTFVEIAGGPKGDELNKQIMAGKYEGIMKTKLAGINQLAYLQGKTQSNRDYFFYYQGHHPIGPPLQELEVLLHHDGRDRRPSRSKPLRRTPGLRSTTSCAIRSNSPGGTVRRP